MLPAGDQDELELQFQSAQHVSDDNFAHLQEHWTVFTACGIMHRRCCLLVTRMRWNCSSNQLNMFGRKFRPSSGELDCVYGLWYNAPTMLPAGDQDEVELKFSSEAC